MDYARYLERAGFRQLQEEIARATGLAVITTDPEGRALFGKSNPPAFCVLINGTPEGRLACSAFRCELARDVLATGEVRRRVCHAGLINIGVPVDGLGVVIAGGVAVGRLREAKLASLAEEVCCPRERLIELAREVPVWTEVRLAEVAGLIRAMTAYAARTLESHRMLLEVSRLAEEIVLLRDEGEIVAQAVQEAAQTLRAPIALLRTYDERKGVLVARAAHGLEGVDLEAMRELPVENSVAG
ncbi:MAG TPA: hypothetical protein DCL13_05545, partial [Peptococcaceae bacterium]|nr:hypothetical protein [Peptococcaceae bacterium]